MTEKVFDIDELVEIRDALDYFKNNYLFKEMEICAREGRIELVKQLCRRIEKVNSADETAKRLIV